MDPGCFNLYCTEFPLCQIEDIGPKMLFAKGFWWRKIYHPNKVKGSWGKFVKHEDMHVWTKFHDSTSKQLWDMFVQSLHFCTVAIAPPLGQSVQYFLAVNLESASTASKKCNKKFHATVTSPSWWGGDDIIVCVSGVHMTIWSVWTLGPIGPDVFTLRALSCIRRNWLNHWRMCRC